MRRAIAAFFLLALVMLPAALSESPATSAAALQAAANIATAEKDMQEMASRGLPVARYNDTLLIAKQVYESQLSLEGHYIKGDYAFVEEKLRELADIKQKAYTAVDEINALEMAIDKAEEINKSAVLEILAKARDEFRAERYEEAIRLVDAGYSKISEEEAFQTKIGAFYEAASGGIAGFFQKWWAWMLAFLVIASVAGFMAYNRIACALLNRKIGMLELRKESIRKLMLKTQKDYFDRGTTGEETYHVRTKKYAELVRDINRQIPLLREELAMRTKNGNPSMKGKILAALQRLIRRKKSI
jgi:hypothetical protein